MVIRSPNGPEVELQISRYQFPDRQGGTDNGRDWDANCLMVRGQALLNDGRSSTFHYPCLTTWEASAIGQWMRDVIAGVAHPAPFNVTDPATPLLMFTEPNLAFSLASRNNERVQLRVHLSLEALPPWLRHAHAPDIFEFFVVLDVSAQDLAGASTEWEENCAVFPERQGDRRYDRTLRQVCQHRRSQLTYEPFVLIDVISRQDDLLLKYRCASSLSGDRWAVICADSVSRRFSSQIKEQQEMNFAELLNEMHPFERMHPRPTLERALAEFGDPEEE